MTRFPCLLSCLLALLMSGCASMDAMKPLAFKKDERKPDASRCVAMWRQAESKDANGQKRLGFSGQLYFFAPGSDAPVPVNGDVIVKVFDHSDPATPLIEYPFTSEQWNVLRSDTQIGPGYGLFVPYPRDGVTDAHCVLQVDVAHSSGFRMHSEPSEISLASRDGYWRPSEKRIFSAESNRRQGTVEQREVTDAHGRVTTIGIEKDGQLVRVQDRVRRLGDATDQPFERPDERELRLSSFEHRLNNSYGDGQSPVQQTGYTQEPAPRHESAAEVFGAFEQAR